ncbi:MAG: UDP-N-acetylglucosamine 1-carboxyvinyltransferase [Candidatus Ryanbacteria bacterium RIFCSPHIGHO2_02_FULL_48_12]|uniref:UDP-N-acetylglucosamine 1-carboxyvinyltransferase n=1 Tax=Candidatus Ryanbacteria bacterium RIFCSPHIGHO2_01_FULL_48_27 TaxID=1802115 RepID=A0A1G2G612_9BACT|nr:MAG: UDP-N-acetylglucosamine 1-carboxyvinyltransferase [Candidatus Ryanbacteria bacterium RIFCSPHIGHO2_01_FULL_48_27]OGZ49871.1 MAG: UDP-N-acetylglucosamine 1-carboxyvinyltransferase [Candidatus Ryanbacteria bacterium RIFCSPHIGHO2_02_FULL_48_12]
MDSNLIIQGGRKLSGTVEVRGSKNAATKLMIASLLSDEPSVIENVPFISDLDVTKELCEKIGSTVDISPDRICHITTREVKTPLVPELSRKNRIPILALGPLLHRKGIAEVPVLGGCPIGHRPVNLHIEALQKMGARIERRENSYYAEAKELHGEHVIFPFPSVGATENVLLAATLAHGTTIIENAAIEPEITNLVDMLVGMGADIAFNQVTRTVEIHGVSKLHGTTIRVMPDRNEIMSFAVAALATEGSIFIPRIEASYLGSCINALQRVGGKIDEEEQGIRFSGRRPYKAIDIETGPHPGFMTDWQQPMCVLLTQAEGKSSIHETVYDDRFGYTKDLVRMGARIEVDKTCPAKPCRFHGEYFHTAHIVGPASLHAAELVVTDLRAGMAHIIAALIASGESRITGIDHIDRGYEEIDMRLRGLGADIIRA